MRHQFFKTIRKIHNTEKNCPYCLYCRLKRANTSKLCKYSICSPSSCSGKRQSRARGRSYHHSLNRRLRCLRQLNQRLWIFAAFLLWQATKSSAATLSRDDSQLKMSLLCTCESSDKKNTENQYGIKENRKSVFALSHKKKLTPSRTISVLNGVSLFY